MVLMAPSLRQGQEYGLNRLDNPGFPFRIQFAFLRPGRGGDDERDDEVVCRHWRRAVVDGDFRLRGSAFSMGDAFPAGSYRNHASDSMVRRVYAVVHRAD